MKHWLGHIGLCLMLISSLALSGRSDTSLVLTHQQWERLRSGLDYTETFKTPEEKTSTDRPSVSQATQQYTTDLKYFIYALVALGLLVLVIVLVKRSRVNANIQTKSVSIENVELDQNVHELDLEALLKDALERQNYRMALRIQFLMVIKALAQRGKIQWAKEKTNWDYHVEVPEKLLADQFRELILHFESSWYGEHQLNQLSYERAEPLYQTMLNQLRPHE